MLAAVILYPQLTFMLKIPQYDIYLNICDKKITYILYNVDKIEIEVI